MHAADPALVERYFDHGTTSFPKPAGVARAMANYVDRVGGGYGRAAYPQAQIASRIVFDVRERLARKLGAGDSSRVVFTHNATHAINLAIAGLVRSGSTVLVSPLEHNSVLRPLELVCGRMGAQVRVMPHGADGSVDPERLEVDDDVCLAVVNLVSNVNGVAQPVAAIKNRLGQVPLLVDAAQVSGQVELYADRDRFDLVAVSGHKGLLGPSGTGALYVRPGLELPPLLPGGTGSNSEKTVQPTSMPDALEGGTPNLAGIAGLGAALAFLEEHHGGDPADLARRSKADLRKIDGVTIIAAADPTQGSSLFSFAVDGMSPADIASRLARDHGIAVRAGLHCAPAAHRALGTIEQGGTVRVCFGRFQDESAVSRIVDAIAQIVRAR